MWEKFIKPNISRSNVVKDSDCRILCIDPQFDQVRLGATVRCLFGWIPSLSSSTQQQVTGEFLPVRSFGQYFEYPHGMCFSIYRHRGCRAERANPRPKVCILNDQANKKWFLNCCPSRFFWMDRFVELGFFSRSFFCWKPAPLSSSRAEAPALPLRSGWLAATSSSSTTLCVVVSGVAYCFHLLSEPIRAEPQLVSGRPFSFVPLSRAPRLNLLLLVLI